MKPDLHAPRPARLYLSSLMASTFLVTACGGGGGDPAPAQAATTDLSGPASSGGAADPTKGTPEDVMTLAATWEKIADEGEWFNINTPTLVRFGAGSQWTSKTFTEGGQCSLGFFGTDPAPTVHETCERQVSSPAPAPTPAPPPPAPAPAPTMWKRLVQEANPFSVPANSLVRFGVGSAWAYKTVSGNGYCSAAFFGGDPAPTVMEYCEVKVAAPAPAPTPAPSPAPAPAPTPAPAPAPAPVPAGSAVVTWTAPSGNVAGYRVYYGTSSRHYQQAPGSGNYAMRTQFTVSNLPAGQTYYFAVTAVDSSGAESAYSSEGTKLIR